MTRTLQFPATRAIVEDYRQKRREERRLIRRKKREQEMREREEIEMLRTMLRNSSPVLRPAGTKEEPGDRCAWGAKVLEASLFYIIARRWRHYCRH